MKVVLYCVSALLILVGAACVAAGFDLTTTERGVALTLSGTICIGTGAVVLGLAAVLQAINALQKPLEVLIALDKRADGKGADGQRADIETVATVAPPLPQSPFLPAVVAVDPLAPRHAADAGTGSGGRPMLGPLAAGAAIAGSAALGSAAVAAAMAGEAASSPQPSGARTPSALDHDIERALDELLMKPPAPAPGDGIGDHDPAETGKESEPDLFMALEDDSPAIDDEAASGETADSAEPDAEQAVSGPEAGGESNEENDDPGPEASDVLPAAVTDELEEGEEPENDTAATPHGTPVDEARPGAVEAGKKVVGSYAVGENQYTLYADGGVEARTPTGLYQFESLEELKVFIESSSKARAMTS